LEDGRCIKINLNLVQRASHHRVSGIIIIIVVVWSNAKKHAINT
jgi:hypothetical protein